MSFWSARVDKGLEKEFLYILQISAFPGLLIALCVYISYIKHDSFSLHCFHIIPFEEMVFKFSFIINYQYSIYDCMCAYICVLLQGKELRFFFNIYY